MSGGVAGGAAVGADAELRAVLVQASAARRGATTLLVAVPAPLDRRFVRKVSIT